MHPKDADEMASNVDPDQTAPSGVVWSGSTLFAQRSSLISVYCICPDLSVWILRIIELVIVTINQRYYTLRHSLTEIQPCRNVHVQDIPVC